MKLMCINQEPVTVTSEQAETIRNSIANGAEVVFVGNEMIRATAISGIRNDNNGKEIDRKMWGSLPEGSLKHFYDDRRESTGEGYAKFQAMKQRLLNK